jgi:hypothetical protein
MSSELTQDPIFQEIRFTQKWIDLGIIDPEKFAKIKLEYLKGEDRNTEHYRWGAFRDFLQKNKVILNEVFYQIYDLGKTDPDYPMGRAMRFDIIKRSDCPVELINLATEDKDKALSKRAHQLKSDRCS